MGNRKLSLWSGAFTDSALCAKRIDYSALWESAAAPDGECSLGMFGARVSVPGNSEEIELVLVSGADAKYELIEDQDSGMLLVRTLF